MAGVEITKHIMCRMLELLFRGFYAETMSYKEYALKAKCAAERIIEMVKEYRNN